MSLTELSVKKPTAIWMAVVLTVALGIIGYNKMGSNLLPTMNSPVISISTSYNGANAEDIKEEIVKPIEDAVSGISGIDKVTSSSNEGYGTVTATFKMSTDMNTVYLDVQKAVDNVSASLPKDADKPMLIKSDTSQIPILILSVSGDVNYDELYNSADTLKQDVEKVQGVAQVSLLGAYKKQLMIKLDQSAMDFYGVSTNSISQKLQANNINIPGGTIKQENKDQYVTVVGQFDSIESIKNLLIPTCNGGNIRLCQVANVELELPDREGYTRRNEVETIGMMVTKQSDANVLQVADKVKKQLEETKKITPSAIDVSVAFDNTTFITSSLSEIKHNVIEGIIVTALVLYLFFRSFRSSLVVLISIPTSLVATFFIMYKLNFTLNIMSLMGLSLVIGTLVDDSIVVLESIQRHLDKGEGLIEAAINGRKEIGLAAIAISICDVVVFAPISLMSGEVGQMFREFGLTIAAATIFSLIVSFTLTPMLASFALKKVENKKEAKEGLFDKIIKIYKKVIVWALGNRWKVITTSVVGIICSIFLLSMGFIGVENMPKADESFFTINIGLSTGSTIKQNDEKVTEVERYLTSLPEVKDYFSIIGADSTGNSGKTVSQIMVNLKPKSERKRSQAEVSNDVREFGKKIPGIDFSISESDTSGGGKPIAVKIQGKNEETLKSLSNEVENIVKSVPGIIDVSNSTKVRNSQLKIKVDSLAASNYGLNTSDISSVVRVALSGENVGVYRANNEENDITLKFMKGQVTSEADVRNIKILASSGIEIPLSQIAVIENVDTPQTITRENKQIIVTVDANIQGRTSGEVQNEIDTKLKALQVPTGYSVGFGGEGEAMEETGKSLGFALFASIALIYMILVVLYESYLTPAIRMVALPFAIMGALIALAITGQTLNMISGIGIIMLEGLSAKNGTLLIDYTNTLMKKGMNLRDALIESGVTRLRPIIMTSATMIVSMLPVAFSLGEGSELKKSMAVVIIGGMIMSTVITPIVIPVVYTLIDDLRNFISRKADKIKHLKIKKAKVVEKYES